MGRIKVYRQNINAQVRSVNSKSIHQWLINQTRIKFGVAFQEAQLIAEKSEFLITDIWKVFNGNQFFLPLTPGINNHQKRPQDCSSQTQVLLTAFEYGDIDLFCDYGLKIMQNSRIIRLLEEGYQQNSLFSFDELCLLTHTTAKSIRERLIPLWNAGVRLPIRGIAKKYRINLAYRSTFVLKRYFDGISLSELQPVFFFSNPLWNRWKRQFLLVAKNVLDCNISLSGDNCGLPLDLAQEYAELAISLKNSPFFIEFVATNQISSSSINQVTDVKYNEKLFLQDLQENHNFSKAKSQMFLDVLQNLRNRTQEIQRDSNEIVYYAISSDESPGKPLDECTLFPILLSWWIDEDRCVSSPDSTEALKWQKILRLSTEAHQQGACLNQADLAFLLAVHPAVIQKQMKEHKNIILPIRGNIADMGPGITHAEKVINLFLQGYTETEIVRRTGHSYSSVENYIIMFSRVVVLLERRMPLPLIRQTIGCSMKLVEKYSSLYHKYNTPDYQFTLMQVRRIFDNHDTKKNKIIQSRRPKWDVIK
jgi:hypothetical protein